MKSCARGRVAIRFAGGLGNQLFQLAAGYSLAKKVNIQELIVDARFIGNYETRRALEVGFLIDYLEDVEVRFCPDGLLAVASRCRVGKLVNACFGPVALVSADDQYRRALRTNARYVLLDGYFQDPEFGFDETTRLNLFASMVGERSEVVRSFRNGAKEVVGVHIRRGDYASSLKASRIFRLLELDYYRVAASRFDDTVRFLVFSDDPSLAGAFAVEIGGINVAAYGLSLWDEFVLLSSCDHHIIANSTFSWWAASLGRNVGKRTICPREWFLEKSRNNRNKLLLPWFELV